MEVKNISINGLELIEEGQGKSPVIFLHGGPGVLGYMDGICRIVNSHCKSIRYDQRGSRQTKEEIRISHHIEDLLAIVRHYSNGTLPTLVGHSWGAMLALLFANQYSERIDKIVLIGCGSLNVEQGDAFQCELSNRFGDKKDYFDDLWLKLEQGVGKNNIDSDANRYINEILEYYQNDAASVEEIPRLHWDLKAAFHCMMESDELTFSNKYESMLSNIKTKVSVIHGTDDLITPESMFTLFKKHLPHTKVHRIERGGHFPWVGHGKESFKKALLQELSH